MGAYALHVRRGIRKTKDSPPPIISLIFSKSAYVLLGKETQA